MGAAALFRAGNIGGHNQEMRGTLGDMLRLKRDAPAPWTGEEVASCCDRAGAAVSWSADFAFHDCAAVFA